MSYILDALKKSDQERQQGVSPNLNSIHGSPTTATKLSTFQQHRTIWLIFGGTLLFLFCFGVFFFLYQQHLTVSRLLEEAEPSPLTAELAKRQATTLAKTSDQSGESEGISSPQVIIKEKQNVLRSVVVNDPRPYPEGRFTTESSVSAVPLLEDLPAQLQAEIPSLEFAGHTYSEDPYQRMIIINGRILREGDMIAPDTYLTEITWEGVTIAFSGTRFRVKAN
jgi:general secretion pathway protein B